MNTFSYFQAIVHFIIVWSSPSSCSFFSSCSSIIYCSRMKKQDFLRYKVQQSFLALLSSSFPFIYGSSLSLFVRLCFVFLRFPHKFFNYIQRRLYAHGNLTTKNLRVYRKFHAIYSLHATTCLGAQVKRLSFYLCNQVDAGVKLLRKIVLLWGRITYASQLYMRAL